MEKQTTLNAYLRQSIVSNWDSEALTNLHNESYLYRDIARKIAKIHIMFEAGGIKPGDKVALVGRNSAEWVMALLAVMTYGAVGVPILSDFKPDVLEHLINHSDSKALFVDNSIWSHLNSDNLPDLRAVVRIEDYALLESRNEGIIEARRHLNEIYGKRYPERFKPSDFTVADVDPDSVILINYTAGSTGFSKGVMLTEHSLWSNIQFSIDGLTFLKPGDPMLSLLPLAHMYGLMFEILHGLVKGCHVFLLNRTPSPKILIDAFATVRPKLIICVPLVIEKIIKTRVFPTLRKPMMRMALKLPYVNDKILSKVRHKLIEAFGGNLLEMIIGGAGLAKDVETFLRKIQFPFTVGYGMTECAPLISYAPWNQQRPGSCGRAVDRVEVHVDSHDPATAPGILWVRGANVMKGYYKKPEATAEVMQDDWMNTGDICQIDDDGYIYIRGRNKNMILGPSGQNIYPEEIEQKLLDNDLVNECIVIEHNGRLRALIHPDEDAVNKAGLTNDESLNKAIDAIIANVNTNLPGYSQIANYRIVTEEFEKTPKRSIKRYLYKE